MSSPSTVLITGASTGIGATYADRFARRGHALVLVARNAARLEAQATRLRQAYGVDVDVLPADLTVSADLDRVAQRLREDTRIDTLINNAGTAQAGRFVQQSPAEVASIIGLNTTAVAALAAAVAPRLAQQGSGAIVNLGSVVGLAPEFGMTVYGATKAFVLFLSQGLSQELSPKGVYVQAVLPATTRTELWGHVGVDINTLPDSMSVDQLVDAALVGFDQREAVTIPALQEAPRWTALEDARRAVLGQLKQSEVAQRYRAGTGAAA